MAYKQFFAVFMQSFAARAVPAITLIDCLQVGAQSAAYKALGHSGPINKATTLPIRTRGTVPGSSMGFRHLTRPSV